MLTSSLLNLLAFCIGVLPDRVLWGLSQALAFMTFDVFHLRRTVILENLNIVFGDQKGRKEKLQIARLSCAHTFLTFIRFFGSKKIYPRQKIQLVDEHNLHNAVAQGKGAYILGIHIGDFELMGPQGTRYFKKTHVVTKPIGSRAVSKWIRERRADNGEFEIERLQKGMGQQKIFEALDRGEIVGFMVDQRRSKGAKLPFFGRDSMTNTSLFYLWKHRPSPIVPVMMLRTGHNSQNMYFLPPFEVEVREGESESDFLNRNSLRMNQLVESMVLRAPEQYFWMHKRWKL